MTTEIDESILRSLMIIPKVRGVISIVGSTLLARHIMSKKRWEDVSLTNEILFGISIVDIITSFFVYFMGTWMVPREESGIPYAAGTIGTCTAQGFFHVFSVIYFATAYTGLAVLYWLIVSRGWATHQMERKAIRFSFLLPPIFVSFCFAVPPLFFDMYNSYFYFYTCFISDNDNILTNAVTITNDVLYGYSLIGNIVVIVFMSLLIFAVYKQEKKADRYLTKGQEKNRKNTYNTAWQGVRFSAAYLIPYFMYYVFFFWDIPSNEGDKVSLAGVLVVLYYLAIVTPMLGAFNSIVYFYPRYATNRKQNPEKPRIACLYDVLGIDICWCCHRNKMPDIETADASTATAPLINEEEDIQAIL